MEFGKTLIRLHLGVTGEAHEPKKKRKQVEVGDAEPTPPSKVMVVED